MEISNQFGPDIVVSLDDLIGDDYVEEVIEEEPKKQQQHTSLAVALTTTSKPTAPVPTAAAAAAAALKKPLSEMTEAERAEEMRRRDAEKLAARKKKFDEARFAHIEQANAKAQEQSVVFEKRLEEKKIPGAKYTPRPAPEPETTAKPVGEQSCKNQKKGWKLVYQKKEQPAINVEPSKPLPPLAGQATRPTNVRQAVTPGWASVDKQNERPQTYIHSSDMACRGLANSAPAPVNPAPQKAPVPEAPKYKMVGYGTSGPKPQLEGVNVTSNVTKLQSNGLKTKLEGPRNMVKPKVIVDTKESFDAYGNITRTITRHITDPDGKKRTETEVVQVPSKK
jgi:hypothetical protein